MKTYSYGEKKPEIHSDTWIEDDVVIYGDVTIKEGIRIVEGVIVGSKANVTKDLLKAGVYVGNPARLFIKPNVIKGKNVRIESGTTIGAQPTTFTNSGELLIAKFGVTIKDDVWIGSDTRVMLGTVRNTLIGKGALISQFCNIGHDVIIGNKADLIPEIGQIIDRSDVEKYVKNENCSYIETSAKTGENVEKAFFELIQRMVKKLG